MEPTEAAAIRRPGAPAEKPTALVRAENVHRFLGSGDNVNHILRGVNLEIFKGEYVSIVGASGSGKSTMLYLLGGLDRPSVVDQAGKKIDPPSRISIDGEDTARLDETALANLRNAKVGFVFQFHYLLKEFTAQENVALPMFRLGRLGRGEAMDRAAMLLGQLGLGDKTNRRANKLSGGEQQRVALARALANKPAVVMADEPTGNLDRKNSDLVAEMFQQLGQSGQTLVLVTHDLMLAARAGRKVTMEDGQVISDAILLR